MDEKREGGKREEEMKGGIGAKRKVERDAGMGNGEKSEGGRKVERKGCWKWKGESEEEDEDGRMLECR